MTETRLDHREKPDRGHWIGRLCTCVYFLGMTAVLFFGDRPHWGEQSISLALLHWREPAAWVGPTVLDVLREFATFALFGWFFSLCRVRPRDPRQGMSISWWLRILLGGVGLVFLYSSARSGHTVGAVFLVPGVVGFVLGAWIGVTWSRGLWAMARLTATLSAGLVGLSVVGYILFALALQSEPLAIEREAFTPTDKQRLTETIKRAHNQPGDLHTLRLTEKQVDMLASGGTSIGLNDGLAEVILNQGAVHARLSLKTPFDSPGSRYLNVDGKLQVEIDHGRIRVVPRRLWIGRVWVPNLLVRSCLPTVIDAFQRDPDLGQALGAIESVQIDIDAVEVVYSSESLDRATLSSLLNRLNETPPASELTRLYYLRLVNAAEDLPPIETRPEANRRFQELVRIAFMMAQERSKVEDPVQENRAALLALAILLGHERVESLVGHVTSKELRVTAHRSTREIVLWDRNDLRKHFLVSAALAVVASEKASDSAGLFKEVIDSVHGGSGFSFADLLADRAGSRLAVVATRDEASARTLQKHLAANFSIDDLCPPPTDLPEGISEEDLLDYYGGVGGANFQRVEQEINRRLDTCDALQGMK